MLELSSIGNKIVSPKLISLTIGSSENDQMVGDENARNNFGIVDQFFRRFPAKFPVAVDDDEVDALDVDFSSSGYVL